MSLKYGGRVFRSLEEQVRQNMSDISELGENLAAVPRAGEAVELEGVSSGSITQEQLDTLQASDLNYILLNGNEIFELADNQAESGFMIYSHLGYNAGKTQAKILSITISTKSFTIVTNEIGGEVGGGGTQLYRIVGTYSISDDPKEKFDAIQIIYTIKDNYIYIISLILRGYQYISYDTVLLNMANIFVKATDTIIIDSCTTPFTFLENNYSFESQEVQFATVTTTGSQSNNSITIKLNVKNIIKYGETI